MTIRVEPLTGEALAAALPRVAKLRIAVFRAFPYLYDGDLAYEESYLAKYAASPGADGGPCGGVRRPLRRARA